MSIVMLLQSREQLSASRLAELLEVSVRTVHRDIDQLSSAGVPVYAERGCSGGFRLLPGWKTQLAGLTSAETDALTFASLPSVTDALGLRNALTTAELKLATTRLTATPLRSRLHIDPTRWFFDAEDPGCLGPLLDAVLNDRRITLSYRRTSDISIKTVDPLGLVLKAGVWYLVARHRHRRRTYRLAQVAAVRLTGSTFERPDDFDLASAWSQSAADYEANLTMSTARIRATPAALERLAGTSGAIAAVVRAVAPSPPGARIEMTVPIETFAHAAVLLLDPELEVLAPPALRQHMRATALAIAAQHR
jgi:predicted DNA-binding transcriptional regulator YafY